METRENQKLLLTVAHAAEAAEISRSKAYELVRSGEWPSIRIGSAIRVPIESLHLWIRNQESAA